MRPPSSPAQLSPQQLKMIVKGIAVDHMKGCILALAMAAVCSVASAHSLTESPAYSVNTNTNRIVDSSGRERFFHGSNVVVKGAPYLPEIGHWTWNTSFVEKDMEVHEQLGLNSIRLGAMWPGVVPEKDSVNQTYLDVLTNIVEKAANYGIHSLLDMHQDSFSSKFCGEGVPVWAAYTNATGPFAFPWPLDKPYDVDERGVPGYADCHKHPWNHYYGTLAMAQSFQNLYDNAFGMRDAWVQAWQAVAGAAKNLGAAVLGYELLNEPSHGDFYKNPTRLIPGVANRMNLGPAWDVGATGIRQVDAEHLIFFAGVPEQDFLGDRFDHVPGGQQFANKSVVAFHYYTPPDFDVKRRFNSVTKERERLQCASFLTEFALDEKVVGQLFEECDKTLQSGWLYWEYKPFVGAKTGYASSVWNHDGSFNVEVAKTVARTYAQAVAGSTQSMFFNSTTKAFDLVYVTSATISNQSTEIYFSQQYHYPGSIKIVITASNGQKVAYKIGKNILSVSTAGIPSGVTIHVKMTPQ